MKYARLVLLTLVGLAIICASAAAVILLRIYLTARGYIFPPALFIGVLFGALGGGFAVAARMCVAEANRLRQQTKQ